MKILATPPPQDFSIYIVREDTRWCEKEATDSLEALYEVGYLPYSGAKQTKDIFYTARSARVHLPTFALSSENRRIARKFDGQFTKERLSNFKPDEAFYEFCLEYFSTKHSGTTMPRERLETILKSGLVSHVLVYRKESKIVAYVLEVADGDMGHYWFSFYDLAYARQSLGMWLMLDAIRDAQLAGKKYYYLGTVYAEGALYKTNFTPLEWWGGQTWHSDISALKELARGE